MRRVFAAAIVAVLIATPSAQTVRLDVSTMLDRYAAGRFDEALRPLSAATMDQIRDLRLQLVPFQPPVKEKDKKKAPPPKPIVSAAQMWIDRAPADRSRRVLAAASFALEVEAALAERGYWAPGGVNECASHCVIEWACTLMRGRLRDAASKDDAGSRDDAERRWFTASITLAGGVRDWTFLNTPLVATVPFGAQTGHVGHALERFPGDAEFRLARAVAVASRFETTTELQAPRDGTRLEPQPIMQIAIFSPGAARTITERRSAIRAEAMTELGALASDSVVGVRARTHLAYLHWTIGRYEQAATEAATAALAANDADRRYLARYIGGLAMQSSGDLAAAEKLYSDALEARPHSQSAVLALAALQFQRGNATPAYALVAASLAERKNDDDPWREFLYGEYGTLPGLMKALRELVISGAHR